MTQRSAEPYAVTDVLVCGGGPAGVAAAVMAARGGARTLLIERYGRLGGMAVQALVGPLIGAAAGAAAAIAATAGTQPRSVKPPKIQQALGIRALLRA